MNASSGITSRPSGSAGWRFEMLLFCRVGARTAEAPVSSSRKEKFSRIQKFCPCRTISHQLFRAARLLAGKVCLGALAKQGQQPRSRCRSLLATLSLRRRMRWRRAAAFRWLASSVMAVARTAAACRRCSSACSARAQHSCSCCMRFLFFVAPPGPPPFPSPTFGGKVCAREHQKKQNSPRSA